jgi:hypothetical protein
MAITYEPIATTTLSSLTTTVTFSSIPNTYTDLRYIVSYQLGSAATGTDSFVRINGDTGTNYSGTQVFGNGSTASSGRSTTAAYYMVPVDPNTSFVSYHLDFMNYANTTTYKPILGRFGAAADGTAAVAVSWRSTSAITSISFTAADNAGGPSGSPDQFAVGSTFTLYGIKAA